MSAKKSSQFFDWRSSETSQTKFGGDSFHVEDDDEDPNEETTSGFYPCKTCLRACLIGSLICGIVLATILALWLTNNPKTKVLTSTAKSDTWTSTSTTTSTATSSTSVTTSSSSSTSSTTTSLTSVTTSSSSSTSSTTTTVTTITTTTTRSTSTSTSTTSTTSTSTSSSTSTTTTTVPLGACSTLVWNQTGTLVAGTGGLGSGPNEFHNPKCLYIDDEDSIYVCDSGNNRVLKWLKNATNGTVVTDSSLISRPFGVFVDKNKYLYVSDSDQHHVVRYPSGSLVGTVVAGKTNVNGAGLGNLNYPSGIVVDDDLNIYIADESNSRIVKWPVNATIGTVVIDSGLVRLSDIAFVPGSLTELFVSSKSSNKAYLWRINAATPSITYTQVNSVGAKSISNPTGLKSDRFGNLYVSEKGNERVAFFCANETIGEDAVNRNIGATIISNPVDTALDSDLNIYVVDDNKKQVFQFNRL